MPDPITLDPMVVVCLVASLLLGFLLAVDLIHEWGRDQ